MQIEVKNVSYFFNHKKPNEVQALNDISLTINSGEFVAFVGQTGSGKSTLMQCLNGLLLPQEGYIKIDDFIISGNKKIKKEILKNYSKEVKKENKKLYLLRKKVGMVFQFPEYQLFEDTVIKDVMFGPKNFKIPEEEAKKNSVEALKNVGIDESYFERSPFELSGGQKRRVAIAGILASNPDILILDEPTAGLDPNGKKEIMNLVKSIHEKGKTIILVTHDMDVVMDYVDKVFVLNSGKLVDIRDPHDLFRSNDLKTLSLEIPTFYKFQNLLKYGGFAGNFDKIDTFDSLISLIKDTIND
ncbi:MAG: energy-coupling factor transporter ATPase [Candidatus Onthovivens sp.]|nr:energy-coupling factor transporter ATPase [Candidatus Onthovivens sp.]